MGINPLFPSAEPTTSTKEMPGAESVRRIKDMPELTDEHISSFRASVSDPERSAAFLSDKLGLKHFKASVRLLNRANVPSLSEK